MIPLLSLSSLSLLADQSEFVQKPISGFHQLVSLFPVEQIEICFTEARLIDKRMICRFFYLPTSAQQVWNRSSGLNDRLVNFTHDLYVGKMHHCQALTNLTRLSVATLSNSLTYPAAAFYSTFLVKHHKVLFPHLKLTNQTCNIESRGHLWDLSKGSKNQNLRSFLGC